MGRHVPWVNDALYGMGRAWQSLKQFDNAVNAYVQVTRRTVSEVAAQAQLQMGICRLEQQRFAEALPALLAVPYSYDYPECSAAAWCEAGRAAIGLKQNDEAARCWRRVIQDHPNSPWAKIARERLAEIKEPAAP